MIAGGMDTSVPYVLIQCFRGQPRTYNTRARKPSHTRPPSAISPVGIFHQLLPYYSFITGMCQRINGGMEVLKKEKILGHILSLSGNSVVLDEEKKKTG